MGAIVLRELARFRTGRAPWNLADALQTERAPVSYRDPPSARPSPAWWFLVLSNFAWFRRGVGGRWRQVRWVWQRLNIDYYVVLEDVEESRWERDLGPLHLGHSISAVETYEEPSE